MKKTLLLTVLILSITSMAYSYEISVGGSFGAGLPILRGDNVELPDDISKLATKTKVDVMIEFMPFLALETGLGFKTSSLTQEFDEGGQTLKSVTGRKEIFIPIMARGQYEYNLGVSYISAGVNLGFPVDHYSTGYLNDEEIDKDRDSDSASFTMDIAFAVGTEFRIAKSHYVGLRLAYDLNVLPVYTLSDAQKDNPNRTDTFMDDFSAGITYRYAFGSKWNK